MTKKKNRRNIKNDQKIEKLNKEAKIVRWTIFAVIFVFVFIVGVLGYKGYHYVSTALDPIDPETDEDIAIEIPIGTSTDEIGQILEENDLIKDKRVFKYYLKFKNAAEFQAGTYQLSQSMDLQTIIDELQTGKVIDEPEHRVTIPEGKDIEQIAAIMAKKLNFSEEEFMERVTDEEYIEQLMDMYPKLLTDEILNEDLIYALEGYLFAGTYEFFEENPSVDIAIEQMIDYTNSIYKDHSGSIEDNDLSFHEILSLASIVEKESKFEEDRPKVAQVFFNRIDEDMRLQSDITALYALREHKTLVSYDDIDVDSPFNTYKVKGITPGPINSPSLESIQAVLEPEGDEFDYIYFYARPKGETFYTKTLDEHSAIVEQYRQEWYDLESDEADNEED